MTQAKHGYSEIDPTVKESKGTTKCGIFKLGTTSTTNVVLYVVLQASITIFFLQYLKDIQYPLPSSVICRYLYFFI